MRNSTALYIFAIALTAALGGLMFGYDWVVIGGAELFYEKYFHLVSALQIGWAMSSALDRSFDRGDVRRRLKR